jgi:hypothetical protein
MTIDPSIIKKIALDIIETLTELEENSTSSDTYLKSNLLKYSEPNSFYVEVFARFTRVLIPEKDNHFKNLAWEKLNFAKNRFVIDANTFFAKDNKIDPKIVFHFVIDPKSDNAVYSQIFSKLLDTVAHEIHHTEQIGPGREAFLNTASSKKDRESAKKNYKYFLLPEEIESMVIGMYNRSKEGNVPLDHLFSEYLMPFIKDGYITTDEYSKVMAKWMDFALSHYPDALFSKKVEKIISNS